MPESPYRGAAVVRWQATVRILERFVFLACIEDNTDRSSHRLEHVCIDRTVFEPGNWFPAILFQESGYNML